MEDHEGYDPPDQPKQTCISTGSWIERFNHLINILTNISLIGAQHNYNMWFWLSVKID